MDVASYSRFVSRSHPSLRAVFDREFALDAGTVEHLELLERFGPQLNRRSLP